MDGEGETMRTTLQREWNGLVRTAELRRMAAKLLLNTCSHTAQRTRVRSPAERPPGKSPKAAGPTSALRSESGTHDWSWPRLTVGS